MKNSYFSQIVSFYRGNRRLPSYREMLRLFGLRSTNAVAKIVKKLTAAGLLGQDKTGRILPTRYFSEVPLLGNIAAGFPSAAEEELLDTISLEEYLIPRKEATYLVKVQGESMKDAGIMPGDLALAERGREARDGDIVIAEVDGKWTMKYLRKRGKKVFLEAANPKYKKIIPAAELQIAAVVVSVIRKYH